MTSRRHMRQVDELLRAEAERRRRAEEGERVPLPGAGAHANNGRAGASAPPRGPARGAAAPRPSGWRWAPIDSQLFVEEAIRPEWLVARLLVSGMPLVIGGPQKSLKTSIGLDLCLSLAAGAPFLGRFEVYRPRRVAVLSGESGQWALCETAQRICCARGLDLSALPVFWQFTLPRLNDPGHLDELAEGIKRDGIEVVLIDPLYLSLLPGERDATAANLYATGPLLLSVARACIEAGATPALCHHATKPAGRTGEPLELPDLAYSGIAEFARQWLLLNRREAFTPGESHRLWLSAGGSCGQGGQWAVDVGEGELREDFTGRQWTVVVRAGGEARQAAKDEREAERDRAKAEALHKEESVWLAALDKLDPEGRGASLTSVSRLAGMSGERSAAVASRLESRRVIESVPGFKVAAGNGAARHAKGVRRVRGTL